MHRNKRACVTGPHLLHGTHRWQSEDWETLRTLHNSCQEICCNPLVILWKHGNFNEENKTSSSGTLLSSTNTDINLPKSAAEKNITLIHQSMAPEQNGARTRLGEEHRKNKKSPRRAFDEDAVPPDSRQCRRRRSCGTRSRWGGGAGAERHRCALRMGWDRWETEGEGIRTSDVPGPLGSHLSVCFSHLVFVPRHASYS
jgi:hypothetical protein